VHGSLALRALVETGGAAWAAVGDGAGMSWRARGWLGGGAYVCAAQVCEIWLSADGLGVAARVQVADIAGARWLLRPGGRHVRWRGGWRA
jgi:hypothetical protein